MKTLLKKIFSLVYPGYFGSWYIFLGIFRILWFLVYFPWYIQGTLVPGIFSLVYPGYFGSWYIFLGISRILWFLVYFPWSIQDTLVPGLFSLVYPEYFGSWFFFLGLAKEIIARSSQDTLLDYRNTRTGFMSQ